MVKNRKQLETTTSTTTSHNSTLWHKFSAPVYLAYDYFSSAWSGSPSATLSIDKKQHRKNHHIHHSQSTSTRQRSSSNPKSMAARNLRRRYILSYTHNTARAVFSKRWMKQALRWDLVGVGLSKMWGKLNSRPLPIWARSPIYQTWGTVFRCDMSEVRDPLSSYPTLAAFFARQLKDGARKISSVGMASPVDGKVISCGLVDGDKLEQIKGNTYSLSTFLGANVEKYSTTLSSSSDSIRPVKSLFQCIIYLHPGDYHRIHFPVDCQINKRKHFPGTLFPVNYPFLKMIPSLFAMNERVVLLGSWLHGQFFSLTAVGAYNVGSITLNFDPALKTNVITRDYTCPNLEYFSWKGMGSYAYDRDYEKEQGHPIKAERGSECGQFHFGSTVVLIFEADQFDFCVKPGDSLKMGQMIGTY
eukprot:TRINITY_DN5514_c0_g1_i1.p1 TRINITY_DN5514_c0_g1~~TRINITY_DN5514_c0_g1_i1.p1  ORF type:complete len:415 (-),score=99.27 TRINITY_DN5514_c0_g1_i1:63-1307(-)